MRTFILALVFVFNGWVVSAQTLCDVNCTIPPLVSFGVVTDAAACKTNCALVMNGIRLSVPWRNDSTVLEFTVTGLMVGTYTFTVEASGVQVTDPNTLQVIDLCTSAPLTFTVTMWPAGTTGSRQFRYYTNYPVAIALDLRGTPIRATATDRRGCMVTVAR